MSEVAGGNNLAYDFKAVSDLFALGLIVRKQQPEVILIDVDPEFHAKKVSGFIESRKRELGAVRYVAIYGSEQQIDPAEFTACGFASSICKSSDVSQMLAQLSETDSPSAAPVTETQPVAETQQVNVPETTENVQVAETTAAADVAQVDSTQTIPGAAPEFAASEASPSPDNSQDATQASATGEQPPASDLSQPTEDGQPV